LNGIEEQITTILEGSTKPVSKSKPNQNHWELDTAAGVGKPQHCLCWRYLFCCDQHSLFQRINVSSCQRFTLPSQLFINSSVLLLPNGTARHPEDCPAATPELPAGAVVETVNAAADGEPERQRIPNVLKTSKMRRRTAFRRGMANFTTLCIQTTVQNASER